MSTYLVGVEPKKGDFTNKDTGEVIRYNNRLLNCVTDDLQNADSFGFSCFQVKLKVSEIALSLGVSERDEAVDTALKNICKNEIEFINAPKNGTLSVVGIRAVFKK
ncbi:MAG: hypothetical protein K2K16_00505 [Ruminococcus sp.]|nr:hypothetical protein [Ruminococcus sp.]